MEEIKDDLTYKIIGCAMKVHSTLRNGFQACLPKGSSARRQEVICQRCLAIESLEYKRIYHPRLKNPAHPKIQKS